jgi:hypothetical protein
LADWTLSFFLSIMNDFSIVLANLYSLAFFIYISYSCLAFKIFSW